MKFFLLFSAIFSLSTLTALPPDEMIEKITSLPKEQRSSDEISYFWHQLISHFSDDHNFYPKFIEFTFWAISERIFVDPNEPQCFLDNFLNNSKDESLNWIYFEGVSEEKKSSAEEITILNIQDQISLNDIRLVNADIVSLFTSVDTLSDLYENLKFDYVHFYIFYSTTKPSLFLASKYRLDSLRLAANENDTLLSFAITDDQALLGKIYTYRKQSHFFSEKEIVCSFLQPPSIIAALAYEEQFNLYGEISLLCKEDVDSKRAPDTKEESDTKKEPESIREVIIDYSVQLDSDGKATAQGGWERSTKYENGRENSWGVNGQVSKDKDGKVEGKIQGEIRFRR